MLTAKEIRESFKDFFRERGHQIVPCLLYTSDAADEL